MESYLEESIAVTSACVAIIVFTVIGISNRLGWGVNYFHNKNAYLGIVQLLPKKTCVIYYKNH